MQIKDVRNNDELNVYAGELAVEMRIYCQNRLENIYDNVSAIIKRLKSLKNSKKKGGKKGAKEPAVNESAIIQNYMQKKDDLEFRTLQELNKQMTNWVETLQSQSFGNRSELDER